MTLTKLLEIDHRFLRVEDEMGLAFAEKLFSAAGAPTRGRALIEALENVLVACKRESLVYPPIILRRKKELQRGTWRPQLAAARMTAAEEDARRVELKRQAALIQQEKPSQDMPGPRSVRKTA